LHASPHAGLDHHPAWGNAVVERLLVSAAGAAAGWLAVACGVMLLARRLSGGVTTAPGAVALVAVCVVGGLLVAVGDLASRHRSGRVAFTARVGFVMAALATALPLPYGSTTAAVMAVATVAFSVTLLVQPWAGPWLGIPPWTAALPPPLEHAVQPGIAIEMEPPCPALIPAADDEHLLQQQERFTRADGTECVRGRLFLAVPSGVRAASGHVGFCPPFSTIPSVAVTTAYDEMEVIVVAAEVLPWGVRVECRLDEPADEPFEIPIEIIASSDTVSSSDTVLPHPTTCES
jgi:hypothetical protein